MSLAFLLDEDVSHRVAEALRQRGVDAVPVHEVGRAKSRVSDEDQLIFATGAGRVQVTYNRADYQVLDATWRTKGRTHAGICGALREASLAERSAISSAPSRRLHPNTIRSTGFACRCHVHPTSARNARSVSPMSSR